MAYTIRRVEYFKATVKDEPGEACKLLSVLADLGVNLIAVNLVPVGPMATQVTLFPDDPPQLTNGAAKAGLRLDGPQRALMIRGDDVLGALADIHARLEVANVNVFASNGISDGRGHYCYVLHVRPEDFDRAAQSLEV